MAPQQTTAYRHPLAVNPQFAPLHDYQRAICNFAIEHPKCGLFLDMGLGKCCDDDTVVPTPTGLRRLGDIVVGDQLFGKDGQPTTVIGVYHHKQKTAYKVTLRDGRSFVCCDEHQIPYQTYTGAKTIKSAPLAALLADYRQVTPHGTKYKYRIPIADAVDYPETPHDIDPYMMGVLLGDGALGNSSLTISSVDEDVVYRAATRQRIDVGDIHHSKTNHNWYFTHDQYADKARAALVRLGLRNVTSHDKFIPEEYLIDSKENRFELLCGLLDTDGHLCVSHVKDKDLRFKHGVTFAFSTTSKQLSNDVATLAFSLGYGAHRAEYARPNRHKANGPENIEYRVTIYTHDTPMTCARKLAADTHVRSTWYDQQVPIVDIERVEDRDMTCFTVDAKDHLYLINDYIVTHNTLTTLELLYELDPHTHVLIVGPKPVVRSTWTTEIEKWGFPFRIRHLFEDENGKSYTPTRRHELYREICESKTSAIWLTNREMVKDLVDNLPKGPGGKPKWPFGMVILDEAQAFKSYNSKRFLALKSVLPQIGRLIELTGTPRPKGIEDLWPLIYLLDEGQRLGPNITSFRMKYMYPLGKSAQGHPIKYVPLHGAEDAINRIISDITVSVASPGIHVPPVTFDDHKVLLSEQERNLYKELVRESVLEFDDGDEVIAANAAVLQSKLSQLASGAIYVNGTHEYKRVHARKLEETLRIIENTGSPVIVAYHFQSDCDMLVDYLRATLDDKTTQTLDLSLSDPRSHIQVYDGGADMVTRWNAGKIPVLLIQPASAGHGLNLQQGGHTLIWYTLPWSLEHYAQTNARIHRQGQTQPVIIHHLMVDHSVDEKILKSLHLKDLGEKALLDAVRMTIEESQI